MPNIHQNQHNKKTGAKKSQHGRVIDLRSLVIHRKVQEASHVVRETEKYLRHANSVLRKAFEAYLRPEFLPETAPVRIEQGEKARKRTARRPLIRLTWGRDSVAWRTAFSTAVFALIASIVIVPVSVSALVRGAVDVRDRVSSQAIVGVDALVGAAQSMQAFDFSSAHNDFARASEVFTTTQTQLRTDASGILAIARTLPFTSSAAKSSEHILSLGYELAEAGNAISSVLENVAAIAQESQAQEFGVVPILQGVHAAISDSREHVSQAVYHAMHIDMSLIPEEYRAVFVRMQDALPVMYEQMNSVATVVETILTIAGTTGEKSYVLLFQNNREMRPTGGFIGSIAIVYVNNGKITSIDVPPGGVYDIAGQLNEKIIAPEPLRLVTPYWNIQDANWFPHFPVSAEKVNWFYSQITDSSVDGVFTFTPNVLESLLTITGPIDLSAEYGVVIDAANVFDELQTRAEQKYDVTQESKKIIGDLTEKLLEQLSEHLSTPTDLVSIAQVVKDALMQKQILAYMTDAVTEKSLSQFDWAGELKSTDRDYLAVFYANVRGGKTDQHIDRTVTHSAQLDANGNSLDTVEIHFEHLAGAKQDYENFQHIEYVRIYVPKEAELVSVSGFEEPNADLFLEPEDGAVEDVDLIAIQGDVSVDTETHLRTNTEFGKKVFGGFMITPIGKKSSIRIQYTVPLQMNVQAIDHYSLLVQKQPGNFPEKDHLKTYISYPQSWSKKYQTSEVYGAGEEIPMLTDQLFGIVFTEK